MTELLQILKLSLMQLSSGLSTLVSNIATDSIASMGVAWAANRQFPWEIPRYVGGIENVKINVMMRIYSNKWHVYAGLAILNPSARLQIEQYASSVTELFKLMLAGDKDQFSKRIKTAGAKVFRAGWNDDLLLKDEVLDQFSLGEKPDERVKNNHLSLLAMVDCWSQLDIVPYEHMICSTPVRIVPYKRGGINFCIALPVVAGYHGIPVSES
jgi:prephenate dehydrogenase (NADP+)